MNRALIARLILKDWYLSRLPLVLIGAAGALSIGLLWARPTSRTPSGSC